MTLFKFGCRSGGFLLVLGIMTWLACPSALAQPDPPAADTHLQDTLNTLKSLIKLQSEMKVDSESLVKQLDAARTEAEKNEIQAQLDKLAADMKTTNRNLREIAAAADIDSLRATEETKFDLQAEVFSLLRPAIKELKDMTSHVRLKADLKEKIASHRDRLPITQQAVSNITSLLNNTQDESLTIALQTMLASWQTQLTFMQSELQSAELQLDKLERSEVSLAETSHGYLKSFFQKRGLYLAQALVAVLAILLLSRLSYALMVRVLPGYRKEHRSFRIRLLDLMHRMITVILAIAGPMVVFYLVEDWVLFSLGILLLVGIGLTLRQALPRYWKQIHLFLNIGSVREGERISLDGLPWRVRQINLFSMLENPVAQISQRVRIDELVDLKSRPVRKYEPWFPCVRGDWVVLSDGMRGKVTGISEELVELIEQGGARRTYPAKDFLALSPTNLSTNFRLAETIGITYNLQQESVTTIPGILKAHVGKRIADEGYADNLLNLRVEFERANTSSLDIVVIADFDGALAEHYVRLRRAIQRWCVEACTENKWEIPFTQLTLHEAQPSAQVLLIAV